MAEWKQVDKVGHIYTAYLQGVLCYKGAQWVGLSEGQSIATGIICGSLFQTTIEVMDGFSTQWGFSIGDFAANALGVGAFALQQKYWGEQRILMQRIVLGSKLFYKSNQLFYRVKLPLLLIHGQIIYSVQDSLKNISKITMLKPTGPHSIYIHFYQNLIPFLNG